MKSGTKSRDGDNMAHRGDVVSTGTAQIPQSISAEHSVVDISGMGWIIAVLAWTDESRKARMTKQETKNDFSLRSVINDP